MRGQHYATSCVVSVDAVAVAASGAAAAVVVVVVIVDLNHELMSSGFSFDCELGD